MNQPSLEIVKLILETKELNQKNKVEVLLELIKEVPVCIPYYPYYPHTYIETPVYTSPSTSPYNNELKLGTTGTGNANINPNFNK